MKNWLLTLALLTLSAMAMAQTHPLDSAGAETLGEHWGSACRLSAGDFDDLLACNEQRSASRNFRSNLYLADNWGTQVCNMLRFQCENRSLMEDRRRKVAEIGGVLRCRSLFGKDVERACGQAPTPDTACPLGDGPAAVEQVQGARRLLGNIRRLQQAGSMKPLPGMDRFGTMLEAMEIGLTVGWSLRERGCQDTTFQDVIIRYCTEGMTDDTDAGEVARCTKFAGDYQLRAVQLVFGMRTVRDVAKVMLRQVFHIPHTVVDKI